LSKTFRFRKFASAFECEDKASLLLTMKSNRKGALSAVLNELSHMNLTRIESRPADTLDPEAGVQFTIDYKIDPEHEVDVVVATLRELVDDVTVLGSIEVPWFPRHLYDLDLLDQRTLDAGSELDADHPGFKDPVYRKRRAEIAEIAFNYKLHDPCIPSIDYTENEKETWKTIYTRLHPLLLKHACEEYLECREEMEKFCGISADSMP
jgi:phenylalanine-4-hydroxylase